MNVYIKSAVYLAVFGGLGYVLLEITTPSKSKLDEIKRQQGVTAEDSRKKAQFLKVLKEASESSEPIYLKKKNE